MVSGPVYFFLIMDIILKTSEAVSNATITRIDNLTIYQVDGENVSTIVSLIRGATKRLQNVNKLPHDINEKILRLFQTTSTSDFNDIFKIIGTNIKLKRGYNKYETTEILKIAEDNYIELINSHKWLVSSSNKSTFYNNNNNKRNGKHNLTCHGCGAPWHSLDDCPQKSLSQNQQQ